MERQLEFKLEFSTQRKLILHYIHAYIVKVSTIGIQFVYRKSRYINRVISRVTVQSAGTNYRVVISMRWYP